GVRRDRTTVATIEPVIIDVAVTDDTLTTRLANARTLSVPLAWSSRLSNASPDKRQRFEIIGAEQGIHPHLALEEARM
ncbi:MAG: DUF2442 domain-containing protein, partial [Acidimicrobiia bacterium]